MQLHDLTEAEWRLVRELILMVKPTEESRIGAVRGCVNGILWRMRTGEPWTQVPRVYGSHRAVYQRFAEWRRSGVWQNVTMILAEARDRKPPALPTTA